MGVFRDLSGNEGAIDSAFKFFKYQSEIQEASIEFLSNVSGVFEKAIKELNSVCKDSRKRAESLVKDRTHREDYTIYQTFLGLIEEIESANAGSGSSLDAASKTCARYKSEYLRKKTSLVKTLQDERSSLNSIVEKEQKQLVKVHGDYCSSYAELTKRAKGGVDVESQRIVYHNAHNLYMLQLYGTNGLLKTMYDNEFPSLLEDLQLCSSESAEELKVYANNALHTFSDWFSTMNQGFQNSMAKMGALTLDGDHGKLVDWINPNSTNTTNLIFQFDAPPAGMTSEFLAESLANNDNTSAALSRKQAQLKVAYDDLNATLVQEQQNFNQCKATKTDLLSGGVDPTDTKKKESLTEAETDYMRYRGCLRASSLSIACIDAQFTILGQIDLGEDLYGAGGNDCWEPEVQPHNFSSHSYKQPTKCDYCNKMLLGLVKQGLRCQVCRMDVHNKCRSKVPYCKGEAAQKANGQGFRSRTMTSVSTASQWMANKIGDRRGSKGSVTMPTRPTPASSLRPTNELDAGEDIYDDSSCVEEEQSWQDPVPPPPAPPMGSGGGFGGPPPLPGSSPKGQHGGFLSSAPCPPPPPAFTPPPPPPSAPHRSSAEMCVALYDYQPQSTDDMAVSKGDLITINKEDGGWLEGTCNGRTGFFPSSYARRLESGEKLVRAVYAYTANSGEELNLVPGQFVIFLRTESSGWSEGFDIDSSQTGVFPENYVEDV